MGKVGTGLIRLFTLGVFGIWTLIGFILILIGPSSDRQAPKLLVWTD